MDPGFRLRRPQDDENADPQLPRHVLGEQPTERSHVVGPAENAVFPRAARCNKARVLVAMLLIVWTKTGSGQVRWFSGGDPPLAGGVAAFVTGEGGGPDSWM